MIRIISCLLITLMFITISTSNVLADDENIQILIDNLPNDQIIIENNLDDVKNKIIQINNIKDTLSEEELKNINFDNYNNVLNIINQNNNYDNININNNNNDNSIDIPVLSTGIPVNETTFPDENFRNYIKGRFGDFLSVDEIAGTKEIDCSIRNIESLKGIEYFTKSANLQSCGF